MKTAVILQSNYLPWKGYFQLVAEADVFVFYDDVQYTKNDWRNRNRVKTANGPAWLTVPVLRTGHANQSILEARIRNDQPWRKSHRRTIEQAYARAPHSAFLTPLLDLMYDREWETLSELNQTSIRAISAMLGLTTEFRQVETLGITDDDPTRRLVRICTALGCDAYLSGPAGGNYLETQHFDAAGVTLRYADYRHREYPQLHGPFEHRISVVDVLAHCGPDSLRHVVRDAEGTAAGAPLPGESSEAAT